MKTKLSGTEETSNKRDRVDPELDLQDIGAGYSVADKRIQSCIATYKEKLLPFFEANPSILRNSNYLSIKGYGFGISPDKRESQ